jgi:hypothetical protein
MTGLPEFNYPAFEKAKKQIGENAISPHDIHAGETDLSYIGYMKRDLKALLDCDSIVMLDGWENSNGAKLERYIAEKLQYNIFENIEAVLKAIDN